VETPLRFPPPKAEAVGEGALALGGLPVDATVAVGLEVGVGGAVLVAQRSTQILGVRGIREREAESSPDTT
jgi:hypothetical protein